MKNEIKTGKPRFITGYTYKQTDFPGEVNNEPSLTVPDMSHTIQDLLTKYTRHNEYMLDASYDDEMVDFDDEVMSNKNFDLVDIQTKQQELEQQLSWIDEAKKQKSEASKGSRGVPPGTSSSTEDLKEPK